MLGPERLFICPGSRRTGRAAVGNRVLHTYLDLRLHCAFDQLEVLPWVEAVAVEADLEDAHVFFLHVYWYHHHGLRGALRPP